MNNLYRFIVAGMLLLAVSPLWSPLRAQVFLPYDATGVTDNQKTSNPSRLAYPTKMKTYIEQEVKKNCGSIGEGLGPFSVSDTKKVYFSPGNLQFNAAQGSHKCVDGTTQPGTWRFAEHQWDYVGDAVDGTVYHNAEKCNNANISKSYNGWIDLFGWGTGNNPSKSELSFTSYSNFVDWGAYNQIGEDVPQMWRTLSEEECVYLFHGRFNYSLLFGLGSVNGVNGMIILPDNWVLPVGLTFTPSISNGLSWQADGNYYINYGGNNFLDNSYTIIQWEKMEAAGAVFLPCAGSRMKANNIETVVSDVNTFGGYWNSTTHRDFRFHSFAFYIKDGWGGFHGLSVRLVSDL